MANKYMDENAAIHFWLKIKEVVKSWIPTKISQLINDSGYITRDEIPDGATASITTPKMDGEPNVGTEKTFARGDHIHPHDSTKQDKSDMANYLAKTDAESIYLKKADEIKPTWENVTDKPDVAVKSDLAPYAKTAEVSGTYATKTEVNGKAAKATTLSGYGISDAYTKDQVNGLVSSALRYKGTKATYSELPKSGNKIGDVWNITKADKSHGVKAGDNVAWNGNEWDILAGTVDLSGYLLSSSVITNDDIDRIVKGE